MLSLTGWTMDDECYQQVATVALRQQHQWCDDSYSLLTTPDGQWTIDGPLSATNAHLTLGG